MNGAKALQVDGLDLVIGRGQVRHEILTDVGFELDRGEALGLIGESGSGKSMTVRSIIRLLPSAAVTTGSIKVGGTEVTELSEAAMRKLRGTSLGVVFQDPRAHINPLWSVGDFIIENLVRVQGRRPQEALKRAESVLLDVGITDAARRLRQRPYELSGGLLQRVMIASVLVAGPDLILADEPTTALDVTTQEEVMAILDEQRRQRGLAMLFISHDLDLADAVCDRIAVMQSGKIVEELPSDRLRAEAEHPYTRMLMNARPALGAGAERVEATPEPGPGDPLLEVDSLRKVYRVRKAVARGHEDLVAVESASFVLPAGGSLAIVGESGSGKSTLARMLVGLTTPTDGEMRLDGRALPTGRLRSRERRRRGSALQMVFQDPYSSLDRRQTVESCLAEAIALHTTMEPGQRSARVRELLEQVGLDAAHAAARPKTLSGGQRQRVAIARALAAEPRALILDEAVAALDVSIQAQVISLLAELRERLGIALLFISHDLPVVQQISDDVIVMHRGAVVESGRVRAVLANPQADYTKRLIDSVPRAGWRPRRRGRDLTNPTPDHVRSAV